MRSLCVIPCWNEENRLSELINQIKKFDHSRYKVDFLFIDNGSTDRSLELIEKGNIPVIKFEKNQGAGYALIYGLKIAKKKSYQLLIHLAANGKMLPDDIPKFLSKIVEEKYDFVHGSRFLIGGDHKSNPKNRIFLIRILTTIINFFFTRKITDATCGFRAYRVGILSNNIKLFDKKEFYTYGYEYYVLGKILKTKEIKFTEVPITMNYPQKGKYSKIRIIIDWYPIIMGYFKSIIDQKKLNLNDKE